MSHDFLVELGTEELPPTALLGLSQAFEHGVAKRLRASKLAYSAIKAYASPRRLALVVEDLDENTPREEVKVWGPPAKVAFDSEGRPTRAAEAFAAKNGIAVDQLQTASDGQQDKLLHLSSAGGESAASLLGDLVRQALAELPINKRMRWGASREEFVRPVQWLVLMLDSTVLEQCIYGVRASNQSRGHRVHHNAPITIHQPRDYARQLLEQGKVIADFDARRARIRQQVEAAAAALGARAVIDPALLDEVCALVEWPVALAGRFDEAFLAVPAEALISSMKEHQKYFHVVNQAGELQAQFITVANLESADPAQVIDGNERVIRPRLADAKFFFDTDRQTSQAARREKLKTVVFQAQLGTLYDKTERIKALACAIAAQLGVDQSLVARAAELSKSDLVSTMVYEFADMQGIAGYHYALSDGEPPAVALALSEQYLPRFAGDQLASGDIGAIVGLADRLDTITGIFGIGQKPSGSKDPFGLRRASLGALRILVEKAYDLDLRQLIASAAANFAALPQREQVVDQVLSYMLERFRAWYEEAGLRPEVFQAVSAKQLSCPLDINNRVYAVAAFTELAEAPALAEANKRVSNILAKQGASARDALNPALFCEAAETRLAQQLDSISAEVAPLFAASRYTEALSALASLRPAVDEFFADVLVMADDPAVRANRLALLGQLRALFLQVADISLLVVKG